MTATSDSSSPASSEAGPDAGPPRAVVDANAPAREALAGQYRRQAYLWAYQLLGNRDAALDVAQDAMVRLVANLTRLGAAEDVRPWLLTIVRNLVRDVWRRQRVRRADSLDALDLSDALVERSPDPEQHLQRRQLQRAVWRAISKLPDEKREILVLREFHDLSYADIAKVPGIPIGTVMSRLHGPENGSSARWVSYVAIRFGRGTSDATSSPFCETSSAVKSRSTRSCWRSRASRRWTGWRARLDGSAPTP